MGAGSATLSPMPTPIVTIAVLDVIRQAGFHLGECKVIMVDGKVRCLVDATDAETGESFPDTSDQSRALSYPLQGGGSFHTLKGFHWKASLYTVSPSICEMR